jgi:hypothetical protein
VGDDARTLTRHPLGISQMRAQLFYWVDIMLTAHIALVSEESSISAAELRKVAGALSKQISRDFGPIWEVTADVASYQQLEDVPLDYWPIIIKDDIGKPTAKGCHEDKHGQPFALVKYRDAWSRSASHECLEMLADPFGRRLIAGESPVKNQGRVNFLVEVCDPCEGPQCAYTINGVQVSDFFTPHFFDPVKSAGVRYSHTGKLTAPRQVLKHGYLSWHVPALQQWWQRTWFGSQPSDAAVKNLNLSGTHVRAAIDRQTEANRSKAVDKPSTSGKLMAAAIPTRKSGRDSFATRADDLREAIRKVSGKAK